MYPLTDTLIIHNPKQSTTLPYPNSPRNLPSMLTDGDTDGPRRMPSTEVLKIVNDKGLGVAKER